MNTLKTHPSWNSFRPVEINCVIGAAVLIWSMSVRARATGDTVYGIYGPLNKLVYFDSSTPGNLLSAQTVTGLAAGEQLRGIAWANGALYGLGNCSRLYIINTRNAAATQVGTGQLNPLPNGIYFSLTTATNTLFACSDLGQNMLVNPVTAATTSSPNYTGATLSTMAYSSAMGTFFGVSASTKDLYSMNPTTGAVSLIGPTGISIQDAISLTVSPTTGTAYLSATVNGQAEFFTVNLTTGAATLVGDVGVPGTLTSGLESMAVAANNPSGAGYFSDSFATGINPANWVVLTNDAQFSVADPGGSVVLSKPAGSNPGFHFAILASRIAAQGDFTAQITFANVNVAIGSGSPGNQAQFDCRLGGQDFLVVRSDEQALGQNIHVYLNPPSALENTSATSVTSGTLTITRTGAEVSGYLGSSLIYQGTFNTNDATFAFCLQNNGTDDGVTATYGNFQLMAVNLTNTPPNLQIQLHGTNAVVSWPDRSWPDYLSPNTLRFTNKLSAAGSTSFWPASSINVTSGAFYSTNALSTSPSEFFRLMMGPP